MRDGVRWFAGAASIMWGDLPTWVAAVATLFALVFAAIAAVFSRHTFQIESERDRINAEARRERDGLDRRAQAALVSAWWGESPMGDVWGAYLRNASETPVYQAHLTVLEPDGRADGFKVDFVVVPPSGQAAFHAVETKAEVHGGANSPAKPRRVKVTFTDAAGVRWMRSPYGMLTQLRSDLVVKTDQHRAEALGQFTDDFLNTYGVTLTFETIKTGITDDVQALFVAASRPGESVDAVIGAHDWVGSLVENDTIEPTILSVDHRAAFPAWTLDALTFQGRLYGLPTTVDTVALIRNTDLAPENPSTMEELLATGARLREAGAVTDVLAVRVTPAGDPFQIWPLFTSAGGWLFGRGPDGAWDSSSIGLATVESVAAFQRLRELGEAGCRVLRRSIDGDKAKRLFADRQTPYLISTSDGLIEARLAGIPLAVTAVPPFADGGPAHGLSLVHGLLMAKLGPNRIVAHDLFADYLSHPRVMATLSDAAVAPVAMTTTPVTDDGILQYQALCNVAAAMPSFPQMRAVWEILGRAQADVIGGGHAEASARSAADEIAAALTSIDRA